MRISVGPPVLTINHGNTFMVTDLNGQINSKAMLGIFADDTRFLSYYACYIDGHAWQRLTSTTTTYYAARIYLLNPRFTSKDGVVEAGTISLVMSRAVEQGIHEDLDLTNYGPRTVRFMLEISLRSDFADIFEVKADQFVRRGRIETHWHEAQQELSTTYRNGDFYRRLIYRSRHWSSYPYYANGRVIFEITLEPGQTWHACGDYILADNEHVREQLDFCYQSAVDNSEINTEIERLHCHWLDAAAEMKSSNEDARRLFRQSVEDVGALRLFDYDIEPEIWLPAAGVPNFVTLFGRDSLIVSLQTMIVHANLARGALRKLAQLQATEVDNWRDAQPGKILHEVRQGELAYFHQVPHTPYYGTADATPLFLITLHETWKWLGDDSLLRDYRDTALRCLEWIDRDGDLDGDGFQEYKMRSSEGIENQGWKDSGDAIVNPDGSQVKAPIALCELQGYVFDAWVRMAEVFSVLGESATAFDLQTKAARLQTQFEQQFWCEELGFYAFALDAEKQPVKTIASNPGHCLWSGIVAPDRAKHVAKRLLQPDMWSGWGIRTLSAQHPAYSPFSYHRGSIWPHDNSIIALGLKRYGFNQETTQVAQGIFDAARYFSSYRIPELYAGIERQPGAFPAPYLQANVPQAWAAAAIFQLVQAMLGLQADAPKGCLYLDPYLPDWLPDIRLRNVEVGHARVDLKCWRESNETRWDAALEAGQIEIKQPNL